MNTNLQTLISLQQTSAATEALQLVGSNVTISGNSATLSNATGSPATWSLNASAPATGNITITNSTGQTAYTGTAALNSGTQSFTWNGQGNNGTTWPDGAYTIAVSATGANGQPVTVSTQVQGVVTAVNMTPDTTHTYRGRPKRPDQLDPIGRQQQCQQSGESKHPQQQYQQPQQRDRHAHASSVVTIGIPPLPHERPLRAPLPARRRSSHSENPAPRIFRGDCGQSTLGLGKF